MHRQNPATCPHQVELHTDVQILGGFTAEEQGAWLKFVTACSRAPLLGFSCLQPKLCIQMAGGYGPALTASLRQVLTYSAA